MFLKLLFVWLARCRYVLLHVSRLLLAHCPFLLLLLFPVSPVELADLIVVPVVNVVKKSPEHLLVLAS